MSDILAQDKVIRLIEKKKTGVLAIVFSRMSLVILLLGSQLFLLFGMFLRFRQYLPQFFGGTILFTLVMVLYLVNSGIDPTGKITWLIVVMLVPFFGAAFYWFTQAEFGHRLMKKRLLHLMAVSRERIPQDEEAIEEIRKESPESLALHRFISRTGCYPLYKNTEVEFFPLGEDKFARMLEELEKAKHFIFMEYFIISEGLMWGRILEVLARKAAEGVEIRVMYDGTCEFALLPHDYPKHLEKLGIRAKVFSPVIPVISTHYNYRDHRKILVIDGNTAFNGGVNIGDEYINRESPYGHWKDTALMLKGEAVQSFTLMFLQLWNITEKGEDFGNYLSYDSGSRPQAGGFVMPYSDMPLDRERVGEMVYIDLLNRARHYVHIMTPYLILDAELENALKFAAMRGVEVKLILPGIPDKKPVYALAKTHFASLIEAGIEIYTYTPGFIHAKELISDDKKAVVGTINLDYRSLYHHFECATYLYETECIAKIERDFQETLGKSSRVTIEDLKKRGLGEKFIGIVLKSLAPLL